MHVCIGVCVYECFIESDSEVEGVGYPAPRNEQKEGSSVTQGILQRVLECGHPLPTAQHEEALIPREQVKHIGSAIPATAPGMQPDGGAEKPGALGVHTQTSGRHPADARGSWEKT